MELMEAAGLAMPEWLPSQPLVSLTLSAARRGLRAGCRSRDAGLPLGAVASTDRTEVGSSGLRAPHRIWNDKARTLAKYGIPISRIREFRSNEPGNASSLPLLACRPDWIFRGTVPPRVQLPDNRGLRRE